MHRESIDLLAARHGHFPLELGHQGDLWLDLQILICDRDAFNIL